MHAAGHQVVACAFGGCLGQDRRFDVLETGAVQIVAQRRHQPGAHAQPALHLRAADVEIAVTQARIFADVVVQHERQRCRGIQHVDAVGDDFDPAGAQALVDLAGRACPHDTDDAQAVLITHALGLLEGHRIVGFDHGLDDAFVIAQIDEDDAAVVAPGIGPSAQGDGLTDQGLVDETTVMAAHTLKAPE